MKFQIALFLIIFLSGCSQLPSNSTSATETVCTIYTKISTLHFDETSSEVLRVWVMSEFPDTQIEDYSQTRSYDYTLEWEHHQIEYFANYQDSKILNIQVIITEQEISPQHIFECLGEPRYYGAGVAGPQLSIGLTYPEKGVNVVGLVRDSPDLPSKDQPIIKIMNFARPTTNLNEFLLDVSPFGFSDDVPTNTHPWEGWENIEIFGL